MYDNKQIVRILKSGETMDRRQQKTQQAIREAFSELTKEKRYSEITVQNILDRANIGRSTFYEHFKTKGELLHAVCADIFAHVFCPSLTPEKHHDFSNTNDFRHKVTHMFYHFSEDKEELCGILRSESKEMFIKDLRVYLNELVNGFIREETEKRFPDGLLSNHLITSLTELILWWMNRDCAETPELIADCYFRLLPSVLQ